MKMKYSACFKLLRFIVGNKLKSARQAHFSLLHKLRESGTDWEILFGWEGVQGFTRVVSLKGFFPNKSTILLNRWYPSFDSFLPLELNDFNQNRWSIYTLFLLRRAVCSCGFTSFSSRDFFLSMRRVLAFAFVLPANQVWGKLEAGQRLRFLVSGDENRFTSPHWY